MSRDVPGRPDASAVLAALGQRLGEAAGVLLGPGHSTELSQEPATRAAELLDALVTLSTDPDRSDARWLLLVALHGTLPTGEDVTSLGRHLELTRPERAQSDLLAQAVAGPDLRRLGAEMRVLDHATVVDVDYCARHDLHAGIQRVVRETLPRWDAEHTIHPVAWTDERDAFRALNARETTRVVANGTVERPRRADHIDGRDSLDAAGRVQLVVPWRSVVVLPDVPQPRVAPRLAALARYSGNTLSMIGYDMIPVISADLRPPHDAVDFTQWLSVVKHAHRVAGISRSAAGEFAGFAQALAAQGLVGPEVRAVPLAGEPPLAPSARAVTSAPPGAPVLLCVGSREPHKNQRAALHAAERLWREGVELEVRVVGGPGFSDEVLRPAIERLVAAGRPLTDLGPVSRERLTAEMQAADVVFFASLHEGYGLPVAEALACGTPVITASFGAQAEVAEGGGCLTLDPRDDDAVTAGIRRLVTDPAERARLTAEALARPVRTWDEYAADLWTFLVEEAS